MQTITDQKRKNKRVKHSFEQEESYEDVEQNRGSKQSGKSKQSEDEPADDTPKKIEKESTDLLKLILCGIDPNHRPLMWWETEHVRYAINYPPVKSRLEKAMGSHVVRLTDYNYMEKLAANLYADYLEQQQTRIEGRKLAPPSVLKRLLELSRKALTEAIRDKKLNKIKMFA